MTTGNQFTPKIIGIICNWCCYGGADLCGVSRFQYPPFIRLIRVMCSARVDPAHIFRAFSNGIDGVFIGGCHLNDCHYVTNGNYDALGMVTTCRKLLENVGINPARLRLEWVSAGEGIRFANIMNEFGPGLKQLGPLGESEGLNSEELDLRLEALTRLVPYLRLVQTQKLQAPAKLRTASDPQKAYDDYYAGPEYQRLFEETLLGQLALSRILLLLEKRPLSTAEIAQSLTLTPSEASKYVASACRLGMIRYDAVLGRYTSAGEEQENRIAPALSELG